MPTREPPAPGRCSRATTRARHPEVSPMTRSPALSLLIAAALMLALVARGPGQGAASRPSSTTAIRPTPSRRDDRRRGHPDGTRRPSPLPAFNAESRRASYGPGGRPAGIVRRRARDPRRTGPLRRHDRRAEAGSRRDSHAALPATGLRPPSGRSYEAPPVVQVAPSRRAPASTALRERVVAWLIVGVAAAAVPDHGALGRSSSARRRTRSARSSAGGA